MHPNRSVLTSTRSPFVIQTIPRPICTRSIALIRTRWAKLAAHYPDDLDAATLYAESMMNLNPWKLWTADGKPAEGTDEIVVGARIGFEARPESSRRESLLHPRGRSVAASRARLAERGAPGKARSRGRSSRAHAGAHLRASRRSSGLGALQRIAAAPRTRNFSRRHASGRLSHDVLQP